jgi:hypothetical protein
MGCFFFNFIFYILYKIEYFYRLFILVKDNNSNMQTRSQTKYICAKPLYEVNIDFDEASAAWKANKKSIGNGSYKYICVKPNKNGANCGRKCITGTDYCFVHNKKYKI